MESAIAGVIAAIITGVVSIIVAVVNTNDKFNDAIQANNEKYQSIISEIRTHNATQDEQIKNLTEQLKKHNSVVERTYHCEQEIAVLKSKVQP